MFFVCILRICFGPFSVLSGVIVSLSEMDYTQNAARPTKKRDFDVADETGTWIRCCALGRNAECSALQEGMQVVLYFGTGRPPYGTGGGCVYLFRDALIVPLGVMEKFMLPKKKKEAVVT